MSGPIPYSLLIFLEPRKEIPLHTKGRTPTSDRKPATVRSRPGCRLFISLALFLGLVLLITPVTANEYFGSIPLTTVQSGVVSGGLYIDAYPGFDYARSNPVQKQFSIPNYTSIQWAKLYVGIYCGNMQNNYPLIAHVSLDLNGDGFYETTLGNEELNVAYSYPGEGGTGPVYINNGNRVTSDYLLSYDVTNQIESRFFGAKVTEDPINATSTVFDGRVKFIALIVAFNDTDRDQVYYWVNEGHDAMQASRDNGYKGETTFSTSDVSGTDDRDDIVAKLYVLHMSSQDGSYTFNTEDLDDPTILQKGSYFGENSWTVTDEIKFDESSTLSYTESEGATSEYSSSGAYYKIPLAALTVTLPEQPSGSLNITSNPPGAQIILDSEDTGRKTNTTLERVETGDHTVKVTLPNTVSYRELPEELVTVKKNAITNISFSFKPITGSVEVATDPEGATIFLDGKNQSVRSNTTLQNVLIGNHSIVAKKTGYRNSNAIIAVHEGKTSFVTLVLNETKKGDPYAGAGFENDDHIGYTGKNLTLYRHGEVHGGLLITDAGEYTGLLKKGMGKTYSVPVNLPENATVTDARLYAYTTWSYDLSTKMGVPASLQMMQGDTTLESDHIYSDRKGGNQTYDYPAETHSFSLDPETVLNGTMSFTITNTADGSQEFAVYGILLTAAYEIPNATATEYWITEGSDLVYANPAFGVTTENATTRAVFPGNITPQEVTRGTLYAVSTAASGGSDNDNSVAFNDRTWLNLLRGGSSGISLEQMNILQSLQPSDNAATITSLLAHTKGDYMENRNLILVLEKTSSAPGDSGSTAVNLSASEISATPLPLATAEIQEPANASSIQSVSESDIPDTPSEEVIDQANRFYDVRIRSNPTGALIYFDYQYTGKTTPDTVVHLRGGNHTVSLELKGFTTAEDRIYLSDNQTLTYDLSTYGTTAFAREKIADDLLDNEVYGGVYVTSMPTGALIYIDGKKTTLATPNIVYGLKPGKHSVRVRDTSSDTTFPVDTKRVIIDPGVITKVTFQEVEMPYFASPVINSTTYAGKTFTLNGQTVKYTFPAQVDLQVADNFLTIKNDDTYLSLPIYPSLNLSIIEVVPRIPVIYHSIYVTSEPEGADIYLDGYATGYTTPYLIRNVSDQKHILSVSKPGYVPFETMVYVGNEDLVRRFVLAEYLYGSLEVTSVPSGARIYLNNKDTSQTTPFTFQYLHVGKYNVKVALNKTHDTAPDVMVEPYKTVQSAFTLTK